VRNFSKKVQTMKLTTLLILTITHLTLGQTTIESIKTSAKEITGKLDANSYVRLNQYRMDEKQKLEISSIIAPNVFWYYELKEYDSDLKKKVYSETDDYKSKLDKLNIIKKDLMKTDYYLDFQIADYERPYFKYNLNTKSFTFTISSNLSAFYNDNFLQFDQLCFSKPEGISVKNQKFHSGSVDVVKQVIEVKIQDDKSALKIEEAGENVRFLFLFKFASAKEFFNDLLGTGYGYREYHLLTNLSKVIVYNLATGEILKELKYIPPTQKAK